MGDNYIKPLMFINMDGSVVFFYEKNVVKGKDALKLDYIDNELMLIASDFLIPVDCLPINDASSSFNIYLAGCENGDREAKVFAVIPLSEKIMGKILVFKELPL